jgi:hypothetical protein
VTSEFWCNKLSSGGKEPKKGNHYYTLPRGMDQSSSFNAQFENI